MRSRSSHSENTSIEKWLVRAAFALRKKSENKLTYLLPALLLFIAGVSQEQVALSLLV